MSTIVKEEAADTAVNAQPVAEQPAQANGTNEEPLAPSASTEETKPAPPAPSKPVEKPHPPVPLLVLPAKAVATHLAQTELARQASANAASANPSRPTVPPLVFPLANIFEERTPLPLSGHNGGLMFGGLDSASHPPGSASSSNPQWDPSDPNVYVSNIFTTAMPTEIVRVSLFRQMLFLPAHAHAVLRPTFFSLDRSKRTAPGPWCSPSPWLVEVSVCSPSRGFQRKKIPSESWSP
jgi:hypothetical protein